jgi:ComF family protein
MYLSGIKVVTASAKIGENIVDIWAVDDFNPQLKEIIYELKYNGIKQRAKDIFKLGITSFYEQLNYADLVTSVPLHWLRFIRRGYNQSEILAKTAARELDIEYKNTMFRTRYNFTQTKRNAKERKKACEGLFALKKNCDVKNKTIIIVDDVCTTGSTVSECARVLYAANAKKIIVLCLAKA